MAQLLKLQDYVSRYQIDLSRYPTQFVRMKKVQWDKVKQQWENGDQVQTWEHYDFTDEVESKTSIVSMLKKFIPSKKNTQEDVLQFDDENLHTKEEEENDDDFLQDESDVFEPNFIHQPDSIEDLKRLFIEQFFNFQIKWASSTIREKSYVDPKYFRDSLLKTLLQRLPDNILIFYYPIIQVKKAPIELDIIVLTPTECFLITVIEQEDQAVFVGGSERFWIKKVGKTDKKILNPLIQLNRMESIVQSLFSANNVEIPVKKILLSRNGYIDYPEIVYNVQFIDKREYPTFFNYLKRTPSPMKRMQLQAAKTLLNSVQTTSYLRDIWNTNDEKNNKN